MSNFAELFSGASHSALYSKYRPGPPPVVINEIISFVKGKITGHLEEAIDVGCGTGQSTEALCPHFQHVTGFDVSETQICETKERARVRENLAFSVSPAEKLPIAADSVQLVTAATAVHWFNLPEFLKEVYRILVPNGVLALYTYKYPLLVPDNKEKVKEVQAIISEFYSSQLSGFWNQKRSIVDNLYEDIEFPVQYFTDFVRTNSIVDRKRATLVDYFGNVSTWSAFQHIKKEDPDHAKNILEKVVESIMKIIGDQAQSAADVDITMEWNYVILMGRKRG